MAISDTSYQRPEFWLFRDFGSLLIRDFVLPEEIWRWDQW